MTSRVVVFLGSLLAVAGGACIDDAAVEDGPPSWDEFERDARRSRAGGTIYVIEGDQRVSADELRAYYEEHVRPRAGAGLGTSSRASTVNVSLDHDDVWRPEEALDLSYCVSDEFGVDKARVVAEMAQATAAWESVANLRFRYVSTEDATCNEAAGRVRIPVRPRFDSGASAFFPSSPDHRELVINLASFASDAWLEAAPNVTTLGVFRHELGHILGLRHEHLRSGPPCGEDRPYRFTTIYDQASVMHYPHCNGVHTSDQSITALDAAGIRLLYGGRNLALGRAATQSSTLGIGVAGNAVDGDIDGVWDHRSVSSTSSDAFAWWQVDLGGVRDVGEVVLYNRTDCCPGRLSNLRVQISDNGSSWRTVATLPGTARRRTPVSVQAAARYVRVQLLGTGYLSLAEVQVLPRVNIAVDGTVSQSSTSDGGEATRAIDATTGGAPARTAIEANPWWDIHLGGVTRVGDIVLHESAGEPLADLDVLVSANGLDWQVADTLRGALPPRVSVSLQRSARKIRIQRRGVGALGLAEVEVFGARNLAAGRTVNQVSTALGGDAANAVDGTDTWGLESVATTQPALRAWWAIDLGEVASVDDVVVDQGWQLYPVHEFDVSAWFDGAWRLAAQVSSGGDHHVVPLRRIGRHLRIDQEASDPRPLALSNVEVYATPNLALGRTATQSSTLGIGVAGNAVDGNADGIWDHRSVTATNLESQPWWQVDLGRPSAIERLILFNRTDCCAERLTNLRLEISVDGMTWSTVATFPWTAGPRTEIPFAHSARYVRIRLAGTGYLSLAEVQVLGTPGASIWDNDL